MRKRYGEVITNSSPLVREQFDRRDQFAIAHPKRIKEPALARKLSELAEAAGLVPSAIKGRSTRQRVLGLIFQEQTGSVDFTAAYWLIPVC